MPMQRHHMQLRLRAIGLAPGASHRAWAVLLLLAIALASFMHVAHSHEAEGPATYQPCTFCTTFDRGGAPPPAVHLRLPVDPPTAPAIAPSLVPRPAVPARPSCRPRAPPSLQA
jgi:hypothetical protein